MNIDPRTPSGDDCSSNSDIIVCGNAGAGDSKHPGASEWSNVKMIGTHGVYALYIATRYGRKYFIKGLDEDHRDLPEWQRFLFKEFELGIQLDHPHIARTVSWEKFPGGGGMIVMEYVDGLELRDWLKTDRGRDRKSGLNIVRQIAEAIEYIHSIGISHRDLKPDNVLVTHNGDRVKIIDFGLGDGEDFVVYKQSAGTKGFGAPEQTDSPDQDASASADIYALGKIIDLVLPARKYRGLIRKCLRDDPASRPSASYVLKQLQKNNRQIFKVACIAIIVILGLWLAVYNSLIEKRNVIDPDPVISTDTVFIPLSDRSADTAGITDPALIPVPALPDLRENNAGTSDIIPNPDVPVNSPEKALKFIWDRTTEGITPAFLANLDAEYVNNHVIPSFQDALYNNLIFYGCPEEIARSKREELATYIREKHKQYAVNKKNAPTDTL